MKQNIITIKNILRIIISVLLISTMIKSCAKAYTWDEFTTFIADYNSVSELSSGTRDVCDWFINFKDTIYNKNSSFIDSCENFYISRVWNTSSRKYYYYFWCSTGNSNISYNSNKVVCVNPCSEFMQIRTYISNKYYIDQYNISTANGGPPDNGGEGSAGLMNFEPLSSLNANTYFQNYYIQPITFEYNPVYSVASGDFTYIKIDYVSNFIPLGVLGNNEYYQLDARFRDELSMKNLFNWSDVPSTGSISSDPAGFKVENSVVYINPIYLNYYRGYDLIFRVWDNSNDYTDFEYLYQFIPMSAVIENGQIVSSGDTTFNGQDLAQYLPQAIVGTAPSGDNERKWNFRRNIKNIHGFI